MQRNERKERKLKSYPREGKKEGRKWKKLKVFRVCVSRYEIRELFDSGALLIYYTSSWVCLEEHLAKKKSEFNGKLKEDEKKNNSRWLNEKSNNFLIPNFLVRLDRKIISLKNFNFRFRNLDSWNLLFFFFLCSNRKVVRKSTKRHYTRANCFFEIPKGKKKTHKYIYTYIYII